MKRHRSWFALLAFSTMTALATGLFFSVLLATASVAFADGDAASLDSNSVIAGSELSNSIQEAQTAPDPAFTGVVTDEVCAGRHDMGSGLTSAECTNMCVRGGAPYALIDGDKKFALDDDGNRLAGFAGQRVTVTGKLNGEHIQVAAIRNH